MDIKNILEKLRILYVEDDESIRSVLSRVLKRKVKELSVAVNGEEGYTQYKSFQPDIIITDIKMPIMSGLEMAKKIREEDKTTPIIITSAHGESNTLFEAIEIGVSGYILKPIDKDKLFNTIILYGKTKILEEDLKIKEKQLILQEKNKALLDMIGNIAHQWRQPLNIISIGASTIALKKEYGILEDKYLDRTLQSIDKNTQYLSKTIDTFRDFLEGDKSNTDFFVSTCIDKALEFVMLPIENNQIEVIKNIDETITLHNKKNGLIQVLINIITNSIEAFQIHKIEKKYISITLEKIDEKIVLSIEDNGGGIDDENLKKVFEPYFTTKHQAQGVGMGLHTAFNIVEESMDGTIDIQNSAMQHNQEVYKGVKVILTFDIQNETV